MVALSAMVMDAGLRLPLSFAVTHMLTAFNIAPLQLSANAWLQIVCTLALYGSFRLYRQPSPLEILFLFKFVAMSETIDGFHVEGRRGKVVLNVPNKARGDPSKWFWVGGAWKLATSDPVPVKLDIPTDFRPRHLNIVAPTIVEISWDFALVWERVWSLPAEQVDIEVLNKHARRLASRVFEFPRHLQIPAQHFPHIKTPPPGSIMSTRSFGIVDRMQPKPNKAKRNLTTVRAEGSGCPGRPNPAGWPPGGGDGRGCASGGAADDRSDRTKGGGGAGEATRPPQEQKAEGGGTSGWSFSDPADHGAADRRDPPEHEKTIHGDDIRREFAAAEAETSRGKPYFGHDVEKAERVLRYNPDCPPTVVDFLSSRVPRDRTEMPSYLTRALKAMPKSWTTDLDKIAERRNPDAMNACLMLTLQAAVMAAQIV
ncbi:hypothetical protein OROHE_005823 [Orobanche hederae]